MKNNIEIIVRALIIRERRILVCQTHGRDYFFLPGGHVEFSETLRAALRRELYEEMGAILKGSELIGGIENIFTQDNQTKHEMSFVFLAEIDLKEIVSREEHITFYWMTMDQFINGNIVPEALKDAVMQWTAEKETFIIESKGRG